MEETKDKKLYGYIFPDFLGKVMSKVDLRTQLEANLMAMSFMSIGLIVTVIYLVVYFQFQLWYKIFLVINGICGLLFFMSNIVQLFQQYQNVREVQEFQRNMKGGF